MDLTGNGDRRLCVRPGLLLPTWELVRSEGQDARGVNNVLILLLLAGGLSIEPGTISGNDRRMAISLSSNQQFPKKKTLGVPGFGLYMPKTTVVNQHAGHDRTAVPATREKWSANRKHPDGVCDTLFQVFRNASIDACRSPTLRKAPRRMALLLNDRTISPPDSSNWNWWGRSETRTGDDVSTTPLLWRACACHSCP